MPTITLPDGSTRTFADPVDGRTVALAIGARLERDAVAVRVDGELRDLTRPIDHDARLRSSPTRTPTASRCIRHSTAHLLAYAVKELFPDAQVTIGPVIENGFYYDFAYKRPFTPEDLEAIESEDGRARRSATSRSTREVMPRDEAVAFFNAHRRAYKAEIIASIPADEPISLYAKGNFDRPLPRPARAVAPASSRSSS